tara:strand:+ start:656 stop:1054 length:399 start_codon:yes stop_codon:yes gene_type:complete
MSKRNQFIKRKNLKENLKKYNAFSLNGYYPLFNTIEDATSVSPVSSYHTHKFENIEYHMPDGLDMGRTQFHGDYNDETTTDSVMQPEAIETQSEVTTIIPPPVVIPEPEPEPIYIPPSTTIRSSGSSGGGGY